MTYGTLDNAILTAIQNGKRDFTSIAYNEHIVALAKPHSLRGDPFRVVDRRLQALRKRGLVEFRERAWRVVGELPQKESR